MIRIMAAVTLALLMASPGVAPAQTNPSPHAAAPGPTSPGAPTPAPTETHAAPAAQTPTAAPASGRAIRLS
ncbi:MAG: hypothetical protein JO136_17290 [Hyphomicrobiales bacterium]|nr:hypothetical protein [Hyphomicrobiales bacterium]